MVSHLSLLEAVDLVKIYPGGVKAVDGISLRFDKGIYSVMGPNGSGKTTTLSMCAGILKPTKGKVYVMGFDMWGRDWIEARKYVGFAPQDMPFDPKLSAIDNLIWFGLLRNMSLRECRSAAIKLLRMVDLYDFRNVPVGKFSGGMRRRLTIISALLHNPEVIILDEPGSGLDPKAKEDIWMYIQEVVEGRTLIFSSHDAREVERFSQWTYIFHRGKVVAEGEPKKLVEEYVKHPYISVWFGKDVSPPEINGTKPLVFGSIAWYSIEDIDLPEVISYLRKHEIPFRRIEIIEPSLNEVFIRLTGERLMD